VFELELKSRHDQYYIKPLLLRFFDGTPAKVQGPPTLVRNKAPHGQPSRGRALPLCKHKAVNWPSSGYTYRAIYEIKMTNHLTGGPPVPLIRYIEVYQSPHAQ
jgi:hypothetical protein